MKLCDIIVCKVSDVKYIRIRHVMVKNLSDVIIRRISYVIARILSDVFSFFTLHNFFYIILILY